MKTSKITIGCLTAIGMSLIVFLILHWMVFGDQSSYSSGLTRHKSLPDTASNISVYTNQNISGVFICDFSMAEKDFIIFASDNGWKLVEIASIDTPVIMTTAKSFNEKNSNSASNQLVDGLYYSKRQPNGGGITVAYDRKKHRGYIHKSSR